MEPSWRGRGGGAGAGAGGVTGSHRAGPDPAAQSCPFLATHCSPLLPAEAGPAAGPGHDRHARLTMLLMLATTVPGCPIRPATCSFWVRRKGPIALTCGPAEGAMRSEARAEVSRPPTIAATKGHASNVLQQQSCILLGRAPTKAGTMVWCSTTFPNYESVTQCRKAACTHLESIQQLLLLHLVKGPQLLQHAGVIDHQLAGGAGGNGAGKERVQAGPGHNDGSYSRWWLQPDCCTALTPAGVPLRVVRPATAGTS